MTTHTSAARAKRDRKRRAREDEIWASKSGEVTTRKMTPEEMASFAAKRKRV